MAEEKKTTTKKTTTKKKVENKEEVKVEKRFCTNCGKELSEGEICSCTEKEAANVNQEGATLNKDAIVNASKEALNTIVNVFKKPDTTVKEEITKKDSSNSIILFITLAISFSLYLMAIISSIVKNAVSAVNNATYGLTSSATANLDVPYFKIFAYGLIIYALMAVIPMFAAFVVGKLTKNSDFSFKKAFKLYISSTSPLIFGYLGMAILLLLNISLLNILGMVTLAIMSIFCFFNFMLSFNKETTIREDRRSYALTSIVVIWVIIEVIALVLVAGSAFSDIYNAYNPNSNKINSTDIFNW